MRKILIWCILLFITSSSWADLGAIKIDSYLNQPLRASIPVIGANLVAPNMSIAVNLANRAKFDEYGIDYRYDIGYLKFKIQRINDNQVNILIISSKPITAPVLEMLLEYRAGNISYYRQYSILLDPIISINNISSNRHDLPSLSSPLTKKMVNSTELKDIPYTNLESVSVKDNENKYVADINYPLIKNQIKNYQVANNIYTTNNDSLYSVAKFMQGIYHNANLDISQFILGIGLFNYQELKVHDGILINGQHVKLPSIKDVEKIDVGLAEQYLLDIGLNVEKKKYILSEVAHKYNPKIVIVTPQMLRVQITSTFVPPATENVENSNSLSKSIMTWLQQDACWILLLLCMIVGSVVYYQRRRLQIKMTPEEVKKNSLVESVLYQPVFLGDKVDSQDIIVEENNIDVVADKSVKYTSVKRDGSVGQDLIQTLLDILTQDQARNDIRIELLSIYAQSHNEDRTRHILSDVANYAYNDYGIINKAIKIASHYGYESIAREILLTSANNIGGINVAVE